MLDVLHAYLERNFTLTIQDKALIKSLVIPKVIRKGEFALREGEPSKYGIFVAEGLLRSYVIDNKGKEHIIQFAAENWWISAKPGAKQETVSPIFIDAVEDSKLLLLDSNGHATLMEKMPGYAAAFLAGMQKRGESKEKRIVDSLSATAEERYNDFLITYPSLAQRIPQHMLAAYLGITPETVSRIRRKAMSKK